MRSYRRPFSSFKKRRVKSYNSLLGYLEKQKLKGKKQKVFKRKRREFLENIFQLSRNETMRVTHEKRQEVEKKSRSLLTRDVFECN